MSQDTTSNVVLGLSVAVLGYVVYQHFSQAAARTASTPAQAGAAANRPSAALQWAQTANALAGTAGALLSPFTANLNAGGTSAGETNGNYTMPQVYDSTSYNPDAINQAMAQDTNAALGAAGMDTSNQYGFYE